MLLKFQRQCHIECLLDNGCAKSPTNYLFSVMYILYGTVEVICESLQNLDWVPLTTSEKMKRKWVLVVTDLIDIAACSMLVLVLTKLVINGTLCICFINHISYNIETHNLLAVLLRN